MFSSEALLNQYMESGFLMFFQMIKWIHSRILLPRLFREDFNHGKGTMVTVLLHELQFTKDQLRQDFVCTPGGSGRSWMVVEVSTLNESSVASVIPMVGVKQRTAFLSNGLQRPTTLLHRRQHKFPCGRFHPLPKIGSNVGPLQRPAVQE